MATPREGGRIADAVALHFFPTEKRARLARQADRREFLRRQRLFASSNKDLLKNIPACGGARKSRIANITIKIVDSCEPEFRPAGISGRAHLVANPRSSRQCERVNETPDWPTFRFGNFSTTTGGSRR